MLIRVENNKDPFFLEIDPLFKNYAVKEIIKELVHKRQQILTLYKSNPETFKQLVSKTISPKFTRQKKPCNIKFLNESTKNIQLPILNLSNFQVIMFGKPLDENKRISEKIGNPKKTIVKITFPEEFIEQLILNDFPDEDEKLENENQEPPTKKQKTESESNETVLKDEDLSHIPKSRILREKLLDQKMQLLILEIDQAKDREKALQEVLKKEPDFSVFVSEMLYLVGERSLDDLQRDLEFFGKKTKKQVEL